MLIIRIAAIIGLAAFIQTALSAETSKQAKKAERIQSLVVSTQEIYGAFLELCQQPHVINGLLYTKDLSRREQIALFMEIVPAVNCVKAKDFVDLAKDAKKIAKAAKQAEKLHLVDQQAYLESAVNHLKLFAVFARKYSGSYKFMYQAAKLNCVASKELPLFKDELEIAPAKTVALAHQKNRKAKFPILDYVHQLDHDLARLYKIQKRGLKTGVREYVKNATIQGELLQNKIIKTSDYAMESRMRDLTTKKHTGLKILGGLWIANLASGIGCMLLIGLSV